MRRPSFSQSTLLLPLATLLVIAACGEGHPPAAEELGGDGLPPASSPPGARLTDASLDTTEAHEEVIGPALCEGLVQRSQEVAEYTIPGPAPKPVGGEIEPGTYVLNELAVYDATPASGADPPPPGPTHTLVRATLYVTDKTIRVIESRGSDETPLPSDTVYATTYSVRSSMLESSPVCPRGGAIRSVPYSMDGFLLTLHVDDTHAELFRFVK